MCSQHFKIVYATKQELHVSAQEISKAVQKPYVATAFVNIASSVRGFHP